LQTKNSTAISRAAANLRASAASRAAASSSYHCTWRAFFTRREADMLASARASARPRQVGGREAPGLHTSRF